jgi:hypothetical protein
VRKSIRRFVRVAATCRTIDSCTSNAPMASVVRRTFSSGGTSVLPDTEESRARHAVVGLTSPAPRPTRRYTFIHVDGRGATQARRHDGRRFDRRPARCFVGYERLLAMRGDHSAPRISYLEGEVEIISPSRDHEVIKSRIGRLLEAWCFDRGVELTPAGSWTIKKKAKRRGAEPDECYIFGTEKRRRHLPPPATRRRVTTLTPTGARRRCPPDAS